MESHHFAERYRGSALVGLLALLLVLGRTIHGQIFRSPRSVLGAGCPPCIIGGFIGLAILIFMQEACGLPDEVSKARSNLHEMVINLVPHAFSALTLGFAAGSSFGGDHSKDKHKWGSSANGSGGGGGGGGIGGSISGGVSESMDVVFASWHQLGSVLWHEGIPMLLYDQVLTWGNSVVALTVTFLWRLAADPFSGAGGARSGLSPYAGAVITLGLEAGRDVLPSQLRGDPHAEATVHLADNTGLLVSRGLGCLRLTALLSRVGSTGDGSSSSAGDLWRSVASTRGSSAADSSPPPPPSPPP